MPLDLEHHRKGAKRLVRAFRAGEPDAVRRAEAVLCARARERFGLSDAQHVVARELGHRSWPDLKHVFDEVEERVVDAGRVYREGEPVRVRVRRRHHSHLVTDDGAAVRMAGKPPGWREVAERVVLEDSLNLSRSGAVFVPTVYPGWVDPLVERVGERSLAVYEALLDLDA
jgi:hypothetical protein